MNSQTEAAAGFVIAVGAAVLAIVVVAIVAAAVRGPLPSIDVAPLDGFRFWTTEIEPSPRSGDPA
jgi:hypothetical protein